MKRSVKFTVEVNPPSAYAELRDVTTRLQAESSMELATMIRRLQRCGHNHNFFVEQDVPVRDHAAVWVTSDGAWCATEGLVGEAAV